MKRNFHLLLAALLLTFIYVTLVGCDLVPQPPPVATSTAPASLQPGLQLTLQALPYGANSQVSRSMLEETQRILEKRAAAMGAASFTTRVEGADRIVVEVRGSANVEELVKTLSQTGYLEFVDGGTNPPLEGDVVATSTGGPYMGNGSPTPSKIYPTIIKPDEIDVGKTQVSVSPSTNASQVDVVLKGDGPKKLADFTTANIGRSMLVVLDKQVLNAPRILSPITGGKGVISGFSANDAKRFVTLLRSGTPPVWLRLVDRKELPAPK